MLRRGLPLFTVILALFMAAPSAQAQDGHLDFKRTDHQIHASVAYGATLSTHFFLKKLGAPAPHLLAATMVLMAGLLKEGNDPQFSDSDMAANAVGVTGATVFTLTFKL